MIAINCTHCKQRLEMDEAFAGGVCRCQHCGTIQTVPSHLKKTAAAASVNGKPAQSASASHDGSGLDELADVVASSSGLARSTLRKKPRIATRAAPATAAAAPATVDYAAGEPHHGKSPLVPVLLGAGVVVLALVGVILYLVVSKDASLPATPASVTPGAGSGTAVVEPEQPTLTIPGPAYADVSLANATSVVYLIDRSQANLDVLDKLKASVYYSVDTLGPTRKFQILFWSHNQEDEIISYPERGFAPATRKEVEAASQQFDDVVAYGNTRLGPSLERAVEAGPDVIVIATAKGLSLSEDAVVEAENALAGTPIEVHTFALGETESPVLKQIADRTGGRYREISQLELTNLKYLVPERRGSRGPRRYPGPRRPPAPAPGLSSPTALSSTRPS